MRSRKKQRSKYAKLLRAFSLSALSILLVLLSSCATFESFKSTFIDPATDDVEQTITIGVFEPQSGRNSEKGRAELKGIELANSIYGSVDGYKVVLSKVDTQSSVSATETAVNGLVKMQPVAIIGAAGEATSLAASEIVEEAKIPAITPSATNPLITQGNNYYFRASLTESQMGQGLAEYAIKELKAKSVGIVSLKNDSNTAAMLDGFEKKVKDLKGKKNKIIGYQGEISPTEEEMKEAIYQLRLCVAKVCLVPLGTEDMDRFFTMVEEKDMTDVVFLGTRAWGDEAFIKMMEKHPDVKVVFPYESVLSATENTSDAITEEAQRFQIEYAGRYGSEDIPTYNAALGYDSYLLIINAIHNAKSLEGPEIRKALMELKDLKCSTGSFTFDSSGNVVRPVTLSTIKDGKPVTEYVSKSDAKSEELVDVEEQQKVD